MAACAGSLTLRVALAHYRSNVNTKVKSKSVGDVEEAAAMERVQEAAASGEEWWSREAIAVVTGANKGIGFAIVREFAKRGITTILTARDETRGNEAVRLLNEEGFKDVMYHQLDVCNQKSADAFAAWVKNEFGGIDILVNNAGVNSLPGYGSVNQSDTVIRATEVIETNYYGIKRVTNAMLPLMKPGSRIVNISSKCGDLDYLKNEWRKELDDISKLTEEKIDSFVNAYIEAVGRGEIEEKGWPICFDTPYSDAEKIILADYCMSKIAVNAYCRVLAQRLDVSVNCMCPGPTSTDMTKNAGHPAELGGDTAVWLALLPAHYLASGKFFTGRKEVGFCGMPFNYNGNLVTFSQLAALRNPTN